MGLGQIGEGYIKNKVGASKVKASKNEVVVVRDGTVYGSSEARIIWWFADLLLIAGIIYVLIVWTKGLQRFVVLTRVGTSRFSGCFVVVRVVEVRVG